MTEPDQLFGEIRDHALGSAVLARRHAFKEWCYLCNTHSFQLVRLQSRGQCGRTEEDRKSRAQKGYAAFTLPAAGLRLLTADCQTPPADREPRPGRHSAPRIANTASRQRPECRSPSAWSAIFRATARPR